jgi:hypothetical protein
MPPEGDRPQPVTVYDAAPRLQCAPSTIHGWALRYNVEKLRHRDSRKTYYDYRDLAVIERELRHGHPIPKTPEGRAEISQRCPLRVAERLAADAA